MDGGDRWLAPLFLGEIEPRLRERFESLVDPDLEFVLNAHLETGRAAWPGIDLDAERFVRHIAAVLEDAEDAPIERALQSLHASDLYLACACVHGVASAIAELERGFIAKLEAPLRATGLDASTTDDVRQRVREILLVGDHGVPGIANYSARGQLRSWMRAVAVRQATLHFRGRRETPIGDDILDAMPAIAGDPQLASWKQQYADAFRLAFEQAITALDERERTLLRQHHIDRLSIDALAALHRIHRATAARWVGAARAALLAGVRDRLLERLAVSGGELDSVLRMVRSQLDVSIHRLLGSGAKRSPK